MRVIFRGVALIILLFQCEMASGLEETEPADRFLAFSSDQNTTTYDLSTVQTIIPGKFTVISTTIDNPALMKLSLTAVDTLYTYCEQPVGTYSSPDKLYFLGEPDMPVQDISVESVEIELEGRSVTRKQVGWKLPYQTFAVIGTQKPVVVNCDEELSNIRLLISNGKRSKTMYDCKHGVMGFFIHEEDDISKARALPVPREFLRHYVAICRKLKAPEPYIFSE